MTATDRFLDSTRGRVLTILLREPRTVAELAAELAISTNATRQHITVLERDGYAERFRLRHTTSKPAALYRVTPDGEALFPKGYEPVLGALVEEVEEEHGEHAAGLLDNVALRLARGRKPPEDASVDERMQAAFDLLTELGAVLEVEHLSSGALRVEGAGCPLGGVVHDHPGLCDMIASMLEDVIVLPVESQCRNDSQSPSCRFLISAEAGEA